MGVCAFWRFLGVTCHLCTPQFPAQAYLHHPALPSPPCLLCGGVKTSKWQIESGVYQRLGLVSATACLCVYGGDSLGVAGPIARHPTRDSRRWLVASTDLRVFDDSTQWIALIMDLGLLRTRRLMRSDGPSLILSSERE